ncbi:aspartate aminotransferase family protein [Oceanidesulfovibrio marinus]|uniref:Aspartate aminotransferase family protein n=1 Tax=Oceanidesulfovibrio marinus TaxID=370038 RepID=A0A6P1ZJL4_9BACT|nr:aspartate aminotransferase family protein [Oceanidesulfovibrio marinus]TVM35901.1 aspartate aminotransferase family protein [Oceanidesulfovibrio marinus]
MDKARIAELSVTDRANVFHPSTHLAQFARGEAPNRIITKAEGIYIEDAEGVRSLDGFSGLYCVNVGYGRKEIADAIAEQASTLAYFHAYVGHSHEPVIKLSERIVRKAGMGMQRVYYGMSGSDANETNIKLVWYYNNVLGRPEKKKIISRQRGYHGSGIMTGSLTGLGLFQDHFDLPVNVIKHTMCPHQYWNGMDGETEEEFSQRCADELEKMIIAEGPDTVAAFIGEPILGTGGIIPPPAGYWQAIQKVLDKYDVLLIADEVITGFGRTGQYFGSHTYGMKPDLIAIAKGLTSAYLPLSGVIVGERVWKVLEQGTDEFGAIGHGWTYSAHPICAAAGNANLDIVDKEDLPANAREVGGYFQQKLHATFGDHPMVGEVRGVGLMAALEFVADKEKKERFDPSKKVGYSVAGACLEEGLIARAMPHGEILGFAPPLIVTKDDIDTIVAKAKTAVDKVYAAL